VTGSQPPLIRFDLIGGSPDPQYNAFNGNRPKRGARQMMFGAARELIFRGRYGQQWSRYLWSRGVRKGTQGHR